jgi:hypothetical protein
MSPRIPSIPLLAGLALLSPAASVAQSTICNSVSNNTVFDTLTSMGGPNLLVALKAKAATVLVATRAEVWTGEAAGTNSIALWSHDPIGDKPAQALSTASWSMTRINGWQGANFASPVVLPANADFWLVWAPVNGAQASIQINNYPGGTVQRGSFDGGQSWNGPYTSTLWKYRVFCGGTPGHFEAFGTGCTGSNRLRPELGFFNVPTLGQSTVFALERALASSTAMLALGASSTAWGAITLPFNMAAIGAPGCTALCSIEISLSTSIDVTGQANLSVGVPNLASLVGQAIYTQWVVLDPLANGLQLVVSNGGKGSVGN